MKRFCENEIKELKYGMDFREPKYRREVFLRFYEFHLKYKSHPGGVYYAFPYIFEKLKMNQEQKYWFCFINGVTQNVVTTFEIFQNFPSLENLDLKKLSSYFRLNYLKFGWDSDRKWVKNKFESCIEDYKKHLGGKTQEDFFNKFCFSTPKENFNRVWDYVINEFAYFGRLSTFSYLEYLKIAGLNIDCSTLFLEDIEGSKSHRNGLCKVLGRDDLDWHDKLNPNFKGDYSLECINWLVREGEQLLKEALERQNCPETNYFTLESTLCCYKSWHRLNRRYPNVYNDMFYERIKRHERLWKKKMDFFWQLRQECLPRHLLLESNPKDPGLKPVKQNHYLKTGQVIMMYKEWSCFKNNFNDYVNDF